MIYVFIILCVCVLDQLTKVWAMDVIAAANGIIMAAEKLGKYKTVCQDIALFILLLAADIPALAGQIVAGVGFGLLAVATVLTIWSGIAYVVKNKQVIKED